MDQNTKMSIYYDLRSLEERFEVRLVDRIDDNIIVQGGLKVSENEESSSRSLYFKIKAIEIENGIKLLSKINTSAYIVVGGLLKDTGTVLSNKFTNHKNPFFVKTKEDVESINPHSTKTPPFTNEKSTIYDKHPYTITKTRSMKMYDVPMGDKSYYDPLFSTKDDLISYIYKLCIKNYEGLYEKTKTIPKDLPVLEGVSISTTGTGQLLNKSIALPHHQLENLIKHPITTPKYNYYQDVTKRTGIPIDQAVIPTYNNTLITDYIDKYKNYPTLSQLVYLAYITKGLSIDNVGTWSRDSVGDFIRTNKKSYYDKFCSIDHMHHFRR